MGDVYRIVTPEGHEYDYHGTVEQLKQAHPGATITGRRMVSAVGEGTYEPYSLSRAQAAERKDAAPARKAAEDDKPAAKPEAKADKPADKPAAKKAEGA